MTSRERVLAAIDHREPDRVPLDIGATPVSGISVSTLSKLRLALGLDQPGDRVRVIEPYQMLGEVTDDLREVLGIDTVGIGGRDTLFGYPAEDWKPWDMPDGTPVLVPGGFNTEPEPNGDLLQYPGGDHSAPASGRKPPVRTLNFRSGLALTAGPAMELSSAVEAAPRHPRGPAARLPWLLR